MTPEYAAEIARRLRMDYCGTEDCACSASEAARLLESL